MTKKLKMHLVTESSQKRWAVFCEVKNLAPIQNILNKSEFLTTLKNDSRSRVYIAKIENKRVVVKFPVGGDKKSSMRIRSLFFKSSYAQRQAQSLLTLSSWGYKTPEVLAFGSRRRFGIAVESFLLMEHLEEFKQCETPTNEQSEQIVNLVKDVHGRGFLHGDPYVQNFLFDKNGKLAVIDALLKKAPFWITSKITEWFHLDWGARHLKNSAIRKERNEVIKNHPVRHLLYKFFFFLKNFKKRF